MTTTSRWKILEHALAQFGYQVTVARDGREALDLVRSGQFRMVVSDWEMPDMTGVELCQEIRRRSASGYVYVILLTSRHGTQSVVDGMNAGADDFVNKPFQPQELVVRIRAGERILSLESRELIIFSMAKLAESRDPDTGTHLERMREYCRVIAEHLSRQAKFREQVDGDYVQLIYMTSPLHDIGKVGIPDRILLKPGRLTREEFEIMKKHAEIGARTLDAAVAAHPEAKFLCMARDIARCHHEKFDGSGYPAGLAGEDDSAMRPDRRLGRRLRRADHEARLQTGLQPREGRGHHPRGSRAPFRSGHRRCLRSQPRTVRGDSRAVRPARGARGPSHRPAAGRIGAPVGRPSQAV